MPRILEIYISPGHDFKGRHGKDRLRNPVQRVDSVECLAGRGLAGDRYLDHRSDFKGQATFFAKEVADELQEALGTGSFDVSDTRRNILVEGVDLPALIGKRFSLGGVVFEGAEECAPCYWMNEALGPNAESLLKGRGGLRCRILESGVLVAGEAPLVVIE